MTTIHINLTGDFAIDNMHNVADYPDLQELDAFLGALRGTVESDKDVFLGEVAKFVRQVKARDRSSVVLEIESTIEGNVLKHKFKLTMEPA